jgi:pyruvate dehydrogenase E2 component (dihydrolipoamide acetyltransferase)
MPEYKLPDVGEGLTEAEIVTWKVKVGDVIAINDIVVEIETAKSLVELPSPYAGTVTALLVNEGETVDVGTPIIAIGDAQTGGKPPVDPPTGEESGSAGHSPSLGADAPEIDLSNPAASGGGEGESLVGRNKVEREAMRRPRKATSPAAAAAQHSATEQVAASFVPGELVSPEVVEADEPAVPAHTPAAEAPAAGSGDVRVLAKPPVRKLAKDLGVDITSLVGSGDGGVVTREDVHTASSSLGLETGASAPSSTSGSGERERREPIKGVRKMMGQAMVDSAFSAPHVTEWVTVDVTRTMEFVERL